MKGGKGAAVWQCATAHCVSKHAAVLLLYYVTMIERGEYLGLCEQRLVVLLAELLLRDYLHRRLLTRFLRSNETNPFHAEVSAAEIQSGDLQGQHSPSSRQASRRRKRRFRVPAPACSTVKTSSHLRHETSNEVKEAKHYDDSLEHIARNSGSLTRRVCVFHRRACRSHNCSLYQIAYTEISELE